MAAISCHSNQSSYPTETKIKYYSFYLPIDAIRIGFMVLEDMSFENVDGQGTDEDGWTTDACLHYKLTYEHLAQVR